MQTFLTETLAKEAKEKLQKKRNLFGLGLTSLIAACSGDAAESAGVDDGGGEGPFETPEQRAARLAREAQEARAEALPIKAEAFLDDTSGFTANKSSVEDSLTVEVEKPGSANAATLTFADGAETGAEANIYKLTPNLDQYDLVISAPTIDKDTDDDDYQKGKVFIYWNVAKVAGNDSTHLEIKGGIREDKIGTHAPDFYKINDGNAYDMVIRSQHVNKNSVDNAGAIYVLWDVTGYAATTTSIALNDAGLADATAGSLAIYGAANNDQIGTHAPDFYKINAGNAYDMVIRSEKITGTEGAIYILWDVTGYAGTTTSITLNDAGLAKATAGSLTIQGRSGGDKIGTHKPDFLHLDGDTKHDMVIRSEHVDGGKGAIYILWDVADYKGHKTIDLARLTHGTVGAAYGAVPILGARKDDKIGIKEPEFLKLAGKDGVDMVIRSEHVDSFSNNEGNRNEGAIYILWDVARHIGTRTIDLGDAPGLTIYGAAQGAKLGSDDNNILYGKDTNGNKILTDIDKDGTKDIAFIGGEYTYILFGNIVTAMSGDTVVSRDIDLSKIELVLDENFDNGNFFSYSFDTNPNTVTTRVGYRFKEGDKKADLKAVQAAYDAGVVDAPEPEFGKNAPRSIAPASPNVLEGLSSASGYTESMRAVGTKLKVQVTLPASAGSGVFTFETTGEDPFVAEANAETYYLDGGNRGDVVIGSPKYYSSAFASSGLRDRGRVLIYWDVNNGDNAYVTPRTEIYGSTERDKIGTHKPEFLRLGGANDWDMVIRSQYVDKGDPVGDVGAYYILWDISNYRTTGTKIIGLGSVTKWIREGTTPSNARENKTPAGSLSIFGEKIADTIGKHEAQFLNINSGNNHDMVIRSEIVDRVDRLRGNQGDAGAIYILWDIAEYNNGVRNKDLNLAIPSESNFSSGLLTIRGARTDDKIGIHAPEFLHLDNNIEDDMVIRSEWVNRGSTVSFNNEGAIHVLWDVDQYDNSSRIANVTLGSLATQEPQRNMLSIFGAKKDDAIGIKEPEFLKIGGKDGHDVIIRSEWVDKPIGYRQVQSNTGAIYVLWDVADYKLSSGAGKTIDLGVTSNSGQFATSGLLTIYGATIEAKLGKDTRNILYGNNGGNKTLTDIDKDGTNDIVFQDVSNTYILFGNKVANDRNGDTKVDSKTIDLNKIKVVKDENSSNGNFFSYDFDERTPNTVTTRVGYRFDDKKGSLAAVQTAYDNANPAGLSDADADLGVWDIA